MYFVILLAAIFVQHQNFQRATWVMWMWVLQIDLPVILNYCNIVSAEFWTSPASQADYCDLNAKKLSSHKTQINQGLESKNFCNLREKLCGIFGILLKLLPKFSNSICVQWQHFSECKYWIETWVQNYTLIKILFENSTMNKEILRKKLRIPLMGMCSWFEWTMKKKNDNEFCWIADNSDTDRQDQVQKVGYTVAHHKSTNIKLDVGVGVLVLVTLVKPNGSTTFV